MKNKKAIYFNGEYNPANPPANTLCITYDEIDGFKFIAGNKTVTLPNKVDVQQNTNIEELTNTIKELKEQVEYLEHLNILTISNAGGVIKSVDKDTGETTFKVTDITTKKCDVGNDNIELLVSKNSDPINTPVTVVAKDVTGKNITIKATNA